MKSIASINSTPRNLNTVILSNQSPGSMSDMQQPSPRIPKMDSLPQSFKSLNMQKMHSSKHKIASLTVPEEEPSTFEAGPKYPTLDQSPSSDH
jgi:hypothetical protein